MNHDAQGFESLGINPREGQGIANAWLTTQPWQRDGTNAQRSVMQRLILQPLSQMLGDDSPETINQDAYKAGWIFRIAPEDATVLDGLMDAGQYRDFLASESD